MREINAQVNSQQNENFRSMGSGDDRNYNHSYDKLLTDNFSDH